MQLGAFFYDEAHDPGSGARGAGVVPLFDRARRSAEELFELARADAPEVAHDFHGLVGAGDAVEFGGFLELGDIDVEAGLLLEPVRDVFACDFRHETPSFENVAFILS